jgi:glycine/D-amino acid oxidase-like deaminating enzyme
MDPSTRILSCDVLIVGGGNAGFSAAVAAAQAKAGKVVLIDKCPPEWAGGNSYFTAGAFRVSHRGLPDILPIVSNVDAKTAGAIDLEPYTNIDFLADLDRVTHGQYDRALGQILVEQSNEAVKWLAGNGLEFQLSFNRQVCVSNASISVLTRTGI